MLSRRTLLKGTATALTYAAAGSLGGQGAWAQEGPVTMRIGLVPLISSGPIFIAMARGFFDKVNITPELRFFADGALAIPALVAGELDTTVSTCNAGLFNAVSKGANYKLFLDRGSEKPGSGSMTIVASTAMHEAGLTDTSKMGMLKGKRLAIQAPGGIDQYLLARGVEKAGLDPTKDVTWDSGLAYPDIIKSMGVGNVDCANIPVPLAFLAEKNGVGKIMGPGADIEPGAQLGCWAMPTDLLVSDPSVAVRFAMVHIHAGRLFNKAAAEQDEDVIKIVSEATKVPPELIAKAAPRWTWFNEDGRPNTASVMAQGRYWAETMKLTSAMVTEEQLLDLSPIDEALKRLDANNPFA